MTFKEFDIQVALGAITVVKLLHSFQPNSDVSVVYGALVIISPDVWYQQVICFEDVAVREGPWLL